MQEQKPGEVIVPLQDEGTAPPPVEPVPAPSNPPAPVSSEAPPQEQTPAPAAIPSADEGLYHPEDSSAGFVPSSPEADVISWEADEFIAHDKTGKWYAAVIGGSVVITLIVYFLNRDIITAALVLIALVGLAAFGGRRPRRQQFVVAPEGIQVGRMFYPFADFRSFAVAEERIGHSLVLISLKRFVPAINIYIPSEYEEAVVNLVASVLPMEPHTPDFVERLMSRIHF